jgi:light-regulated signal transduction histidine kinase (bacteriophytochrome)/ActR/RegA family two-component response regulator
MSQSPERPGDHVDLTTCDREPIHLLGAVQPFGFLLSVNAEWIVVRATENTRQFVGLDHVEMLGQAVDRCIAVEVLHDIRGRLQMSGGPGVVERLFGQRLTPDGALFDVAIHQSGHETVLEFEPSVALPDTLSANLRTIFARLERHQTQRDMCRETARQVRAMTGFDRVMVYRFDHDGAGEVIAESATSGLPSFLGLRYPAADIPAQARALYVRNILRLIVDVDAPPVLITPQFSPEGAQLDLSMSVLRSVSPIHLEYLRNMGVKASMSISILRGGKLWGLIACHHGTPNHVGFQTRSMAELFGQMVSYLLEVRDREEQAAHDERARDINQRIVSAFASPEASLRDLPEMLLGIPDYIPADGIGIYQAGELTLAGVTPTSAEFLQLVRVLNKTMSGRVFATHCLKDVFPPAADFVARAAGLISLPISRIPRDYLVFFRREVVRTVTWAGEATKTQVFGPNGPRLTPRKSFEAWQEIVQNQSEHWSARDLRAAEALRLTLVELVLRTSDAAQNDRLAAEQRNEIVIAELNHRVRNILGLVRGLITQTASQSGDTSSLVEGLSDRIRSLARAYDLLSTSNWNPASLHDLLRAEIEAYDKSHAQMVMIGPDVMLQPKAFSAMALVTHELTTNARKYGALSTRFGKVTVETGAGEDGSVEISWRETGGPPVVAPLRRGFGTSILEQLIPFEADGTSTPSFPATGFRLDIRLPPSAAVCVTFSTEPESPPAAVEQIMDSATMGRLLATSLVVEDNLFIALDAEDILRKLGAARVDIAKSVAEALALNAEHRYSFALLDVNLGSGNSLPVARALIARGTPFVFGTGYGDAQSLDEALAAVPVISKPYHPDTVARTLSRLAPSGDNPASV